jgi:hypothetical protein
MRTNQAKMDATLKEMREEATAKLEANNEKFHILGSRMGIHQTRTEDNQREITEMEVCLGKTEARIWRLIQKK